MSEETNESTGEAEATSGGGTDIGLLAGIVVSFGSVVAGMYIEGSSIGSYMVVSAFIIVFGGTVGAVLSSVGLQAFLDIPKGFMYAVSYRSPDRIYSIRTLVRFAEKARREGLLVLENDLEQVSNEFMRKGVQLVVDGTDPELVKEILQTEVDAMAELNEKRAAAFKVMGGFSPTLGIIGTVMGLVMVLGNLSDAASLGPAIAVAFVATWYGVSLANLIYLPVSLRIAACVADEVSAYELMLEGILSIQSGDNPRILEEKLVAFLDPVTKLKMLGGKGGDDAEMDLAA